MLIGSIPKASNEAKKKDEGNGGKEKEGRSGNSKNESGATVRQMAEIQTLFERHREDMDKLKGSIKTIQEVKSKLKIYIRLI